MLRGSSKQIISFSVINKGASGLFGWYKPSSQKFKDQDSQRPKVHTEAMAFIQNDLRCDILRSPTERPCLLAALDLLCKTKVNLTQKMDQSEPCSVPNTDHPGINSKKKKKAAYQFYISIRVQHEVLRLQVPVNDSFFVKVLKRFSYTSHTELGSVLVKASPENISDTRSQ